MNEQKPLIQRGLVSRVRAVKLPPLISFSHSGIESLSLWTVVATGLVIGFLSGFMGAGGGFVRMPAFIYLIGCTTIIAVGTSLFADIFSGGYGLFTHALKGNLDLTFAVVILVGILMGVIVGVERSKNARGVNVRYMFSIYLGLVAFSVLCHLLSDLFIPHPTGVLCEGILLLASVLFAAIIIIQGPRD